MSVSSTKRNPLFDLPLRTKYGAELIHITPDVAQHWLTFNTTNRQMVQARIDQYIADLQQGKWSSNGEAIKFAAGKLLDGQNRLTASVLANAKFQTLVVFGLDAESQVTMDTGRGRTPRDVLSIEGLNQWDARTAGAAIHGIISTLKGGLPSNSARYENQDVRNFFLEHRALVEESLRVVREFPRRPAIMKFSTAVTLHYLFCLRDKEAADGFFNRLFHGEGLTKRHPVSHLRQLLLSDMQRSERRSGYETCLFIVNAWNAFRRGADWAGNTALFGKPGEFPEIK